MEMGKTYGYAGKICYCGYAREANPYHGFRDSHIQKQIDELKDLIKKYLEPRTIPIKPEPEPEPCEHEPILNGHNNQWLHRCHKCGAKIKAKEWIEV